jgi:8-hydroxy-5-deazaflavin:NADPH oxidoreductase
VFIIGDDAGAKGCVSSFIESLGFRSLDVGDLKMAHWLEGAGLLMSPRGRTWTWPTAAVSALSPQR